MLSSINTANASGLSNATKLFEVLQTRVSTGRAVLSAADDAARYSMSTRMLGQVRALERINANLSTQLAIVERASRDVKQIIGLVETAQGLARKAQAEEPPPLKVITPSQPISPDTVVTGYAIGARFSITSDRGQNFTFNFNRAGITWGEVARALNASDIGVRSDFIPRPGNTSEQAIRFFSTNGRDFRFDGISDQSVMDDLASGSAMNPATGQVYTTAPQANALFGNLGTVTASETGLTVGYGGAVIGTKNVTAATAVAAGSVLVFRDHNGAEVTLSYPAATTLQQVMTDINSRNTGIRAELVNQTATGTNTVFSLRNTFSEGSVSILAAVGSFSIAGALGLAPQTGAAAPAIWTRMPASMIGTNVATNGSFEGGVLGPGNIPPGWTSVGTGNLGLDNSPGRTSVGIAYVPLDGWASARGAAIQQTMTTVAGAAYQLSIDAGTWFNVGLPQFLRIEVLDGATVLMDVTQSVPPGIANPNTYTFPAFTATSGSATVRLSDVTPNLGFDQGDLDIDNLRIIQMTDPNAATIGVDLSVRMGLAQQYDAIRTEIDRLAQQSGVGAPVNLLQGQNFRAQFGLPGTNSELLFSGLALSSNGALGMTTSGNTWHASSAVQLSYTQTVAGLSVLREYEGRLGTWLNYLRTTFEQQETLASDFKALGDEVVGADMAEDSARMSAVQLRLQFMTESFTASNTFSRNLLGVELSHLAQREMRIFVSEEPICSKTGVSWSALVTLK
jgi:flagellin-like hook-associated protein FlgL